MVRKSRPRSSSLFLIELILAILFFSVASAVCLQLFVKSHLLSKDSNALNHAVNECASVAEIIGGADSAADAAALLQTFYPDVSQAEAPPSSQTAFEADVTLYYDDVFAPCKGDDTAIYLLTAHLTEEENMVSAHIRMVNANDAEQVIYELETKHHVARKSEHTERGTEHAER